MLAQIVPAEVAVAEAFGDIDEAASFPDEAALFPAEAAAIASAVQGRRRTFATGRACARRALGELGLAPVAIPRGARGEPCWPAGVLGSITHCDGYRAAAVARSQELLCLGIDAEPHGSLPRGVLARIALARERSRLEQLAAEHPPVCWDRLLFSAKESVYKAIYPLTGERFEFKDVSIALDALTIGETSIACEAQGGFQAHLPAPPAPSLPAAAARNARPATLIGRWLVRDGLLLTAVAIPTPVATPARHARR
jgi:4'-phosphopantetheinyl transferase EntD